MLFLLRTLILSLCLLTSGRHIQKPSQLVFTVSSGGNDNYFLRDNVTAAQLGLTNPNISDTQPRRLVVALPAGNSGALTYFLPLNETEPLAVSLANGSFQSTTEEFNNRGIQADLTLSTNATLGVTIIGSVRAMRGECCYAVVCFNQC